MAGHHTLKLGAFLRALAHRTRSTALALVHAYALGGPVVWRWRQGHAIEPLLRRVVDEQLVLISSGGSDWLESSGTAEQVDDRLSGYRTQDLCERIPTEVIC